MEQTQLKIRATDPDGTTANITEACRSITWSGDYRNAARTLSYSPIVCQDDIHLPRAPTELGGEVQFWRDSELLMDAFALELTRDSLGITIYVTAYDRGLYLTRNSTFLRVEGRTAEAVTASLCGQFGIQAGTLAATGVTITRNFLGVSLYKIIMTMYTLASDQTGKKYRIRFRGAKLEVVEMAQSEESVILVPGSNLLSCVTKESASAMTNSVAIYDDGFNLVSTRQDDSAVALYGLMQTAIRSGAYDDPEGHARQVLAENGLKTTITVNALGDLRLITGNTVVVKEPVTGIQGLCWIISDTHTWTRNLYQTKLTLSLEALMDSQTAGSEAKK
ncbi:MAG: hypothetical protein K2K53_07385 [Oscillospiraceae bacterium]|nr:hypothetical protein [Oscillospiraceae bacterium]